MSLKCHTSKPGSLYPPSRSLCRGHYCYTKLPNANKSAKGDALIFLFQWDTELQTVILAFVSDFLHSAIYVDDVPIVFVRGDLSSNCMLPYNENKKDKDVSVIGHNLNVTLLFMLHWEIAEYGYMGFLVDELGLCYAYV